MNNIIIITGGAGFIGSNFLNRFVLKNPNIIFVNVDCLTYAGSLDKISMEVVNAKNYFFEKIDIKDIDSLKHIYNKYSPTDIIHFAAESHVDNSIVNPSIFLETNILGTQNLLELHRHYNLNRFLFISTDEIYGELPYNRSDLKFTEESNIKPNSPYSVSKASADMLVRAYYRTYGINSVITRCSNNYGPNQDKEKLIPYFIWLLKNNKKVKLYGDGKNIRDWIYVDDHNDGVWEVFNKGKPGEIYNLGGNSEKTNLEVTRLILNYFGLNDNWIEYVDDRLGHDRRYAIDYSKISSKLGWKPKVNFEDGIKKTIMYYDNLYNLK